MYRYFNLLYFYLFILIIWVPLQIFILGIDGAGVSLMLLSGLLFFDKAWVSKLYQTFLSKPFVWWALWIVYNSINTINKGITHDSLLIFLFSLLYPFLALCVTYLLFLYSSKRLFNIIILSFYCYLILVLLFDSGLLMVDRLDGKLNANLVGIFAFILVFFLILKYIYKHIGFSSFAILSIVPVTIIILSASRKSFGALSLLLVALLITQIKGPFLKKFILLTLSGIIFYVFTSFILENTIIGDRFLETTEVTENNELLKTGTVLDYFGDRGVFYYYGWKIFLDHPITGIGLKNFMEVSSFDYVLHSEYMVHLVEGGIIGSIFFSLFYLWIGKKLIKLYKRQPFSREKVLIYGAGFCGILFINTAAWTYEFAPIFILFGTTIGFISSENYKVSSTRSKIHEI